MDAVFSIRDQWLRKIEETSDLKALDSLRVLAFGKQGQISSLLKTLVTLSAQERQRQGDVLNQVRAEVMRAFENKQTLLRAHALEVRLAQESLDVTLSVDPLNRGRIHPLSQALFEAIEILQDMGFSVAEGPDIETDFYNFTALNVPETHPARQEQDTFYLPSSEDGQVKVLRTHTSPVQIRTMESWDPPLQIIAPGRVYRSDHDQTHTPTFHQIEGLYVDRTVHMGHLRGCLLEFLRRFFKLPTLKTRMRPSYFPFTEPSAEIDIACSRVGEQLHLGQEGEWLEILGCGMVHASVLKAVGINSGLYQGFAFGMGVERLAMLKYGIGDVRAFYDSDVRWLGHYGFSPFVGVMGAVS